MAKWVGRVSRRLNETDSTNRQARFWAQEDAPHGAIVVANQQTAGRGRLGRSWISTPGMGLWLSIILRPVIPVASYPLLSFAMALAAADACTELSGVETDIKWPNDLLMSGRKIAGILAEMEGNAVIIGIGINLSQGSQDFPPELSETAGSIRMLTGVSIDIHSMEAALLEQFERRIDSWEFLGEYRRRCSMIGAPIRIIETSGETTGVALGVDDDGALRVRDTAGMERRLLSGDVSIRKLPNSI